MQELYSKPFDRIVSLGSDCRVRYQVSLSLYKRGLGGAAVDMAAFEKALYTRAREATASEGSYFFDWNVSPIEGV
ncbi:MAG TPA: hypothetical protein PKE65_08245, partial [Rhizobiaceae bacterium]|nr:hypothetical protein [Rhizobiaceae bacterium]